MKVFLAQHNSDIYEGAPYTLSVHSTESGAQRAIDEHKRAEKENYDKRVAKSSCQWPEFGWNQEWFIEEMEVIFD